MDGPKNFVEFDLAKRLPLVIGFAVPQYIVNEIDKTIVCLQDWVDLFRHDKGPERLQIKALQLSALFLIGKMEIDAAPYQVPDGKVRN